MMFEGSGGLQYAAVVFDLDLTLVESAFLEPLRRSRRWSDVYSQIPKIKAYSGIDELLSRLANNRVPVGIVTSSPRPYCEMVLAHCGWSVGATVCYHDTRMHKPHPDPILAALTRLGAVIPSNAIAVGDAPMDVVAARAAGAISVAALWGAVDANALRDAEPDTVCQTVADLLVLLGLGKLA